MNKTLIALAVAAVVTAPVAAQAGVEVYGKVRTSVDFVNTNSSGAGQEDSVLSLSSNSSRLGFKGDEDLGNGLFTLWQIEQQFDIDTGNTFASARDTFVGVGGSFGTVLAGKLSSPYKEATAKLDIFSDTRADYNALVGIGFDTRASNTIQYLAPDMNGFTAAVAYAMAAGSNGDNLPITIAESDRDAYSLSGSYNNGPIFATAAYESANAQSPFVAGEDASAWKLGGSYTIMDATTVGAIWESTDFGGSLDRDVWYLNVVHKTGDTILKGAFAMADELGGIADTGATQFSLGVAQNLSKSTEVYALYTVVSNDPSASFGLKSNSSPAVGEDMSAFSFGINHKFSSK